MYLDVFNKVVDSDDFTVGGGSASALAGAMAAGMASMVAKLSMAKPVNLTQEEYTAMSKELDELAQTLLKGSEQDTEAYCMIKDAFALPKSTDEEKEVRKQAVVTPLTRLPLFQKTTAIIIRESTSLYAVSRVLPIRPAFQTS